MRRRFTPLSTPSTERFGPGIDVLISSHDAIFIEGARHEVQVAMLVALVVAIAIIYRFVLDWRAMIATALILADGAGAWS